MTLLDVVKIVLGAIAGLAIRILWERIMRRTREDREDRRLRGMFRTFWIETHPGQEPTPEDNAKIEATASSALLTLRSKLVPRAYDGGGAMFATVMKDDTDQKPPVSPK